MVSYPLILGRIYTWGNYASDGSSRLSFDDLSLSSVNTGWPVGFKPMLVSPLQPVGKTYPFDTAGLGPAELVSPVVIEYRYLILAPQGYTDAAAFTYVRSAYSTIWNFFFSSYTLDSVSGVSGQRGWLVVLDEDELSGHLYKAKARVLTPGSFELVKGEPGTLEVTLTFGLLEPFALIT